MAYVGSKEDKRDTPNRTDSQALRFAFWKGDSAKTRHAGLFISTVGTLSGCATSLSEKAKLLTATQECGGRSGLRKSGRITYFRISPSMQREIPFLYQDHHSHGRIST